MERNKINANFFWNSSKISLYEYSCLKSFIKNNFNVRVFSYKKIELPKGAKLIDAKIILSKNEIKKFVHQKRVGCLAAFSDKFRVVLQKKN